MEEKSLEDAGREIRRLFLDGEFSKDMRSSIDQAYQELCRRVADSDASGEKNVAVAARRERFMRSSLPVEKQDSILKYLFSSLQELASLPSAIALKVIVAIEVYKLLRNDRQRTRIGG